MKDQLGGVKPSWDHSMCHIDHQFPSLLPTFLLVYVIGGEGYICLVLRNNSSVHSVAVAWSVDILVLTASSLSLTVTSSPFFIFPWEWASYLFFRLLLCLFLLWPGLPIVVFQLSPWVPSSNVNVVWPPTWPDDVPPFSYLVLRPFSSLSQGPASHLTFPRTIWSDWTQFRQSSLALCNSPLESLFKMVHIYYTLCSNYIFASWLGLILLLLFVRIFCEIASFVD